MTGDNLRQKYLDFFKSKGHAILPSASLLPENDASTLFIGSGMQPLVPYLLGEKHPQGVRLVNSQKSFRAEDLEEVGDGRHTTFFEMLGNWSLGDYFKKEQLRWVFEFLTEQLNVDPNRLYVTVFKGNADIGIGRDDEAVGIWKELFKEKSIDALDVDNAEKNGMGGGKIFYYAENKNWWSRSGAPANMPVGEPGGPDSEIFYDLGADLQRHENSQFKDKPCHVNCDCGRFVEIGNSVFMEFIRTETGFEKLKQQNVDFGGGFERMTMVVQGKDNIFETDLFINVLNKIKELSGGKEYKGNTRSFEVIADHLRGATFIMGDPKAVAPSNVDQGYMVRRLIRRAIRFGKQLGITSNRWTKEIAKIIINDYKSVYPEISRNEAFIIGQLEDEEDKFQKTVEHGLKEFNKLKSNKVISGYDAFNLYQTYGFPIEMTIEMAKEDGLEVDEVGYKTEIAKHQELSRSTMVGKFKSGLADASKETTKLHTTSHLMLAAMRRVLGDHVHQKGSNITPERLRFDFSHPEKVTTVQLAEIERIVNEVIQQDLPVTMAEMPLEKAKKIGAEGVFESKYGEKVKVYTVGRGDGEPPYSQEICGGPHVERTGELGHFKIRKEESSSAGIRRIKAVLE
jgi:alanyl-tRNA synthetase